MANENFICKGCGHDLPKDFSLKTPGYCYLCDPNISLEECLSDKEIKKSENIDNILLCQVCCFDLEEAEKKQAINELIGKEINEPDDVWLEFAIDLLEVSVVRQTGRKRPEEVGLLMKSGEYFIANIPFKDALQLWIQVKLKDKNLPG